MALGFLLTGFHTFTPPYAHPIIENFENHEFQLKLNIMVVISNPLTLKFLKILNLAAILQHRINSGAL